MIYSKYRSVEDPLYYPVVIKQDQRFWKRILIVDDNEDVITTFKVGIEDSNKSADVNKRIEVYTSNNPVLHCQNSNQISMIFFWLTLICHI